jgi:hypothetical protein
MVRTGLRTDFIVPKLRRLFLSAIFNYSADFLAGLSAAIVAVDLDSFRCVKRLFFSCCRRSGCHTAAARSRRWAARSRHRHRQRRKGIPEHAASSRPGSFLGRYRLSQIQ